MAHSITDADQRVQALAAVAGAAAAGPDLRELTGAGLVAIEDALHTVAGRTLTRRTAQWDPATGPRGVSLGHEELQQAAIGYLGPAQLAGIVAACMPGPTLIAVPAHDRMRIPPQAKEPRGDPAGSRTTEVAYSVDDRAMFRRRTTRRQDESLQQLERHHQDDLLRKQLLALEAVSARHSAHITIMWQAPSLGVAAQAFLLTIALAPGSSTASRITVSVLGIVIAALASQFMAKHRHASQRDGKVLEKLVDSLDMNDIFSVANEVKTTWLSRRSSYVSWRIGLTIFLVVNMAIFILAIVHPDVFGTSPAGQRV